MKQILPVLSLGLCSAFSSELYSKDIKTDIDQPNIVIMFMDDFGYNDIGFRNSSFITPNIDKLAKESYNFEHCYVPSPTSSPSRVGLLTGRHPLKVGFTRHVNLGGVDPFRNGEFTLDLNDPGKKVNRRFLPLAEVTFAEMLKNVGYTTAHVGKWHLGDQDYYPNKQGFDIVKGESPLGSPISYFPPYFKRGSEFKLNGTYLTDYLTNEATNIIKKHNYSHSPLCVYLAHYGVHSPHQAPQKEVKRYMDKGMSKEAAIYHVMVEAIDRSVERVLNELEQVGQTDNTIFIFLSDQGSYYTNHPLRGGKLTGALYEGGARVPFFVKIGNQQSQIRIKDRVSTLDIFPTLIDWAGGCDEEYRQLDGYTLLPLFHNKKRKEQPIYMYRSYDNQPAALINNDYKLIYARDGHHELYDLKNDPYESKNLIHDRNTKSRRNKMLRDIRAFMNHYETPSVELKQPKK